MKPVTPPQDDPKRLQAVRWCMRLAEGGLSEFEASELETWLAADLDHQRYLDQAAAAWSSVEQQALGPQLIAMRAEALADVRRTAAGRRGMPPRWISLAGAACLVVASTAAGLWWLNAPTVYVTNVAERRVVMMPDGSRLSLDALTRVKVHYSADRREFWLESGRAKFDVAKNPLRPFTVLAEGKLVVATGTQFSVEVLQQQVRVDLFEGHVAVLNDHKSGGVLTPRLDPAGGQYLAPGEELIASPHAQAGAIRHLGQADAPAWEGGQLVFADEPLSAVVERANRYSRTRLILADSEIGRLRISGVFAAGNTGAIVTAVTDILPVRATEDGDTVRLDKIQDRNNSAFASVQSDPVVRLTHQQTGF